MFLDVNGINTFYGPSHVLHDVSLSVGEGEVTALLGRNGAGKTTTLRSIMGLTPCQSGAIKLDNTDISRKPAHEIARLGFGYVPESREVFSLLSVKENLNLGARLNSSWSLDRVLECFPALIPLLNRKGSQLSGGQQQMMVIGRALLCDPRILLLDEPSQGLAPVIVNDVMAVLEQLKKERLSVLLVEQSIDVAMRLADRVYIMEHGRIVASTTPDRLAKEDAGLLERYIGLSAA